jgi:hypothetical protein
LLSCRLTVAQAEHGNDSPEADAVREDMDGPWYKMSKADIERVNSLRVMLNSFDIPDGPQ